jgi:DNA ligase-1
MTKFPTLYHKAKGGELRQWRTWADGDCLYTEHGMVGGVLQESCKKCVAKNVGKKNATTPETQAVFESEALHKFKLERKYSLTPEEAQMPLMLPMLAHKYDKKKHNGAYFIQPKLDGVRCIARWEGNDVVLYSRQGKVYDVKHISEELKNVLGKDDVFDGELYIHGMQLQSQISLVKKPQPNSLKIKYWVYDMPVVNGNDGLGYNYRQQALGKIFDDYYEAFLKDFSIEALSNWNPAYDHRTYLVEVDTYYLDDTKLVNECLEKFIGEGFEGAILRGVNSEYLWGYRSDELLKVKTFQDSEFKIVDIIDGTGKMAGHAIFVCQNDLTNSTFKAVPKMTMEMRADIWKNRLDYIGKSVTVSFFDRTEDSIPRFPVAVALRDYE